MIFSIVIAIAAQIPYALGGLGSGCGLQTIGADLVSRPRVDDGHNVQVIAQSTCLTEPAHVTAVQIFAVEDRWSSARDFRFQLWRPVGPLEEAVWQVVDQTLNLVSQGINASGAATVSLQKPLTGDRGDCLGWFHSGPGVIPYDSDGDEVLWARGDLPQIAEVIDLHGKVSGSAHRTYSLALSWIPGHAANHCLMRSSQRGVAAASDIVRAAKINHVGEIVMFLGVGNGDLSLSLAEYWPSAVWYLIDPFVSTRPMPHSPEEATDDDYQDLYEELRRRLRGQETSFALVRDFSFSVAKSLAAENSGNVMDERPALVFRDLGGGHAGASADLAAWWPLVRPGGFLAGSGFDNPEIQRAVDDFASQQGISDAGETVWPAVASGESPCWVLHKSGQD